MSIRSLISATLAVALVATSLAESRRDLRGASAPPPVVSQAIAAQRGEKVQVPLAIHGSRDEALEFIIRTPPAHGKLSAIRSTGGNSAGVTYTPSSRTAAGDQFSYAVRGSEGVSAPGVITLRFVDPVTVLPKLKAPAELEFPPVFPGQRSTVEMELTNDGGGILEGEVTVPEPWSIDGLKLFRIAAGKHATFTLVFAPAQPGVRTGEAVISGTERRVIPLRASAEERLAATPAQLKLNAQPGSRTRMGVMKIENHADDEATVTVEADAPLLTDRIVKVPAHGESTVPVFADAAESEAFDSAVKLTNREWKATIAVHAVAVGAILRFTAREVNIAGTLGGSAATGTATLENCGGEPATVRVDVEPPFDVEARVVTAPARGSVEIPIRVADAGPGSFRSSLKVIGENGSAMVPVKAEISEAVAKPKDARASVILPENTPRGEPKETAGGEPPAALIPQTAREIPNALGKFVRHVEMGSATLEWPADLGPVQDARFEERVLSLSGDALQIGWSLIPDVSITRADDRFTAELRGLAPGTYYTVRLATGKVPDVAVLFTSDFWTVAKKPFFTSSLRTPLFVVALVALLFAVWRARNPKMPVKT